jgi:N-acetylneuraminic acid mutarotase
MRPSHLGRVCVALVLLIGCSDDATEPPAGFAGSLTPPALDIADAAHAGNAHFYLLPPLVPNPSFAGVTDPGQSPDVLVCEWAGGTCRRLVALFTPQGGTAAQSVRYDAAGQQYIVNWQTDQCWQPAGGTAACTLDPTKTYRLRILVGASELGHADLRIYASNQDAKNLQTGDLIPLVNGRTLPVKFRIEQGAVATASAGVPAAVGTAGGAVTATVSGEAVALTMPAGAVGASTSITVTAAQVTGQTPNWSPVVDLGPSGTTFAKPVLLTLGFDPTQVPAGVPASALGIYTFDGSGWVPVPGGDVDSVGNTVSAPISHFSYYTIRVSPNTVSGTPTATNISVGQTTTLTGYLFYFQSAAPTCYYIPVDPFHYQYVCHDNPLQVFPAPYQAVYWSSSAPGVASVPQGPTYTDAAGAAQSPPVTGIAGGSTTILASSSMATSGVGVTVQPLAQMSVSPAPSGFVIRVPAGQSLSRQIQITSANGISMQGVVVGPVSDYNTGAIYSWITTSLSATSGTAITLTVTASPPSDQPVQSYNVRFDIAAANAASVNYWLWPFAVTSAQWKPFPSLPSGRYGFTTVTTPDGIYVIGGNNGSSLGALNGQGGLADNLFLSTSSWSPKASMPVTKWYTNGGAYLGGKIYVFGGGGDPYGATDTWIYNIGLNQWQPGEAPPVLGTSCGFSAAIGGVIYVAQEYWGGSQELLYRFDPGAAPGHAWTQMTSSLGNHCFGAWGVIDGKIYAAGGEGQPQTVTEMYDPSTNTWSGLADLPFKMPHATGIAANGKLYVVGGTSVEASPPTYVWGNVEVYDPATNTWDTQTVPSLATPRQLFGGTFYAGNLEVFGGDLDGTGTSTASGEYFLPQ